jgi:hypothetical protein
MLIRGDRRQPAVRIAVGALAGAGSAEAQAALLRVLDARVGDRAFLELLVPTMGFTMKPTPALEAGLARLADGSQPDAVREMAHLALGGIAARLQAGDPDRAAQIVRGYDAKLTRAVSSEEIGTYLAALGNAGTAGAAEVVARYLHDERREVRSEAIEALRRVPTAAAEAELTRALREDPDEKVRASAAWALSHRSPSTGSIEAEAAALFAEQDATVAKQLVENLWRARNTGGDTALTALARAAESHPVSAVRERARALLTPSASQRSPG